MHACDTQSCQGQSWEWPSVYQEWLQFYRTLISGTGTTQSALSVPILQIYWNQLMGSSLNTVWGIIITQTSMSLRSGSRSIIVETWNVSSQNATWVHIIPPNWCKSYTIIYYYYAPFAMMLVFISQCLVSRTPVFFAILEHATITCACTTFASWLISPSWTV